VSYDGGVTWQNLNLFLEYGHVSAGRWTSFRSLSRVQMQLGETVRVGLHVDRGSQTGGNLITDSYCNIRVRFEHNHGTSAP
jgi:hypothetical protein